METYENITFELICIESNVKTFPVYFWPPESIPEIKVMIQDHLKCQMSWSRSFKGSPSPIKRLSSQQLLDLPNPSVCLVLFWMMLYESIF